MNLIIVAGMPATGKTTIVNSLQKEFSYPVFEKDLIKEELFDTIGFECYAEKRALDHAANASLLYVIESELKAGRSIFVVNNFDTSSNERLNEFISEYKPNCVTIFLTGEEKVLYERYVERDKNHARHLGHIVQEHYPLHEGDSPDYTMTPEEFNEKFVKRGMTEFSVPGNRLNVDATDFAKVDIKKIVDFIKENL